MAEPLLICDLPGQNFSLGSQLRDDSNSNQVLDSLDGRVDGPDLSLDMEILQTLAETEGQDLLRHEKQKELMQICAIRLFSKEIPVNYQ